MHTKVLWITRTAILLALLIVLQAVTTRLGATFPPPWNSILTGSIVNMMLVVSVMTCGYASGAVIAAISPVMPTLLGFGPTWLLVPFIAAGNLTLVTIWHFIGNRKTGGKYTPYIIAALVAAAAKFAVLYSGIILLALPIILKLPKNSPLSTMFSYPQLITATIGGFVAILIFPTLRKAIQKDG